MTRKEAIKELQTRQGIISKSKMRIMYSEAYLTAIDMACKALENMPVKGEYIRLRDHDYVCSECGQRNTSYPVPWGDFCGTCGADMRESIKHWREWYDTMENKRKGENHI